MSDETTSNNPLLNLLKKNGYGKNYGAVVIEKPIENLAELQQVLTRLVVNSALGATTRPDGSKLQEGE